MTKTPFLSYIFSLALEYHAVVLNQPIECMLDREGFPGFLVNLD